MGIVNVSARTASAGACEAGETFAWRRGSPADFFYFVNRSTAETPLLPRNTQTRALPTGYLSQWGEDGLTLGRAAASQEDFFGTGQSSIHS